MSELFSGFLGSRVIVKAQDQLQLEGRLVHVDRSPGHNGGFGNLILEGVCGRVLVKGAMVVAVLKR
jgi:small nuclear ribonucleoprotein (snRNP)-like protein